MVSLYYRVQQRCMNKMSALGDSLSPPRNWWDYVLGIWEVKPPLAQTASDVAGARAHFLFKAPLNPELSFEAMPTLVDGSYRFIGMHVREYQSLTHYFMGVYFNNTDARLRIYRSYAGLPKVVEGNASPLIADACLADHAFLDVVPKSLVRGLSPGYTVNLTFYDGSTQSIAVPAGSTYVQPSILKLAKRLEVYDRAKRLVASYSGLHGGLDDHYLGGPSCYVLLGDGPLTWNPSNFNAFEGKASVNELRVRVSGQELGAVDTEFTQAGYMGLRCVEAPSEFRKFVLRRW